MTSPTRTAHLPDGRRDPARVVLVDDSPDFLWLLRRLLAADDAVEVVAEAADGKAALETIARLEPDLVITDLQMPGMDGIALTRAVRRIHPQMPIVLLTARQGPEIVAEAADAGVTRYLAKGGDLTARVSEMVREFEGSAAV